MSHLSLQVKKVLRIFLLNYRIYINLQLKKNKDKSQNKNILINEAFSLSSLSNFQQLTVLPPTANHFQPIHSRTPSTEIKEVPKIFDTKQSNVSLNNINNMSDNLLSAGSFFDQPVKPFNSLAPSLANTAFNPVETKPAEANMLSSSSLFTPVPSKPQANQFGQPPSLVGLSNMPPPSTVPPPLSKPSSTASNPYSAKGALNKKVYDNIIPTVALPVSNTSPALFLSPQVNIDPQQQVQTPPSEMFTPMIKSASNASLTQSFNSAQLLTQPNSNASVSALENT